jgi:hypothetical protein
MWVVYQKKDRRVVGMSAICDQDLGKDAALGEIVRGLVSGSAPDKYDALQVTDPGQAMALVSAPLSYVVIGDGKGGKLQASVELPRCFRLLLESDAPDVHPVDGMPEIKADGVSYTTIRVQKLDEHNEPQKARSDNDELHLRTSAGTLLTADGKEAISTVKLKQGQASFRLQSEQARRVATIELFNGDASLQNGAIRVEFI